MRLFRCVSDVTTALAIPWFTVGPWNVGLPGLDQQLTVEPFQVSVIAAVIVGLAWMRIFATKHGRSLALTMDLAFYLALFGFPASWVLNGFFYEPDLLKYLLAHPSEVLHVQLGWSSYGGIVGCILGAWVWKWRTGASILRIGDAAAFAVPFGWSIARVGCFVSHDHPGHESNSFLAVANYRVGMPPYEARHDLGLYEALVFVALAVVFAVLARQQRPDGFYVAILPLLYTPFRFTLDFLRALPDQGGDIRYAGLTPAQYASVAFFAIGLVVLQRIRGAAPPGVVSER